MAAPLIDQDQTRPAVGADVNDGFAAFPPTPTPSARREPARPRRARGRRARRRCSPSAASTSPAAPARRHGAGRRRRGRRPSSRRRCARSSARCCARATTRPPSCCSRSSAVAAAGPGTTAAGRAVVAEVARRARAADRRRASSSTARASPPANRVTLHLVHAVLDEAGPDSAIGRRPAVAGADGHAGPTVPRHAGAGSAPGQDGHAQRRRPRSPGTSTRRRAAALTFALHREPACRAARSGDDLAHPGRAGRRALARYPEGPSLEELGPLGAGVGPTMTVGPTELPMFPLGSVLFPSLVAAAARVRAALPRPGRTHCSTASSREFGVVLIERGSEVGGGDVRTDVGTVARIVEAAELPDGRWALAAVGVRRIRVVEWLPDDPYPRAEVERLATTRTDEPSAATRWDGARSRCCGGSSASPPSSARRPSRPTIDLADDPPSARTSWPRRRPARARRPAPASWPPTGVERPPRRSGRAARATPRELLEARLRLGSTAGRQAAPMPAETARPRRACPRSLTELGT